MQNIFASAEQDLQNSMCEKNVQLISYELIIIHSF